MSVQALAEICKDRGLDAPCYINAAGSASPGHQPNRWWAYADITFSPWYRTILCRDDGCKRGAKCAFAHGESELRPKPPRPSAEDSEFLYEVAVRVGTRVVRARADEVTTNKSEAKEAAANKVLQVLLDELEDVPTRKRATARTEPAVHVEPSAPVPATGAAAPANPGAAPLSAKTIAQFVEQLLAIVEADEAVAAKVDSYEAWLGALGGRFGVERPLSMAAIKESSLGGFRAFIRSHGQAIVDASHKRALRAAGEEAANVEEAAGSEDAASGEDAAGLARSSADAEQRSSGDDDLRGRVESNKWVMEVDWVKHEYRK